MNPMRRVGVGIVLTAVACVACSSGQSPTDPTAETITMTDEAGHTTVVTQEVTPTPEPTADEGDAAPPLVEMVPIVLEVPEGGQIAFDMPDTWRVVEMGPAERTDPPDPDAAAPQQWCLEPPEALPAIDGCAGVFVAAGPSWLPGNAGAAYSPRQAEGWHSTPAPMTCPVTEDGQVTDSEAVTAAPDNSESAAAPTEDEDDLNLLVTASEGMPLTTSESQIQGRTVTYETWRASCTLTPQVAITPQVWHDPELGVLVRDYFGNPDTISLVSSLRESR